MSLPAFLSAILALLLAPGPTNTLMALAGTQSGLARSVRLIPAEVFGYLITILALAYMGAELLVRWPLAGAVLKGVAALWVLLLAFRLWRAPASDGAHDGVSAERVFFTTLLNPKALIFALVLLPPPADQGFAPRLAAFVLSVVMVALLWSFAGSLARMGDGSERRMDVARRIASIWLAAVSFSLFAGMLRA